MADNWSSEVTASLHDIGFGVRADITERFATGKEPGRADLMCVLRKKGVYIEIKSGRDGFDFANWRENQREWYYQFCSPEPFGMELYIWLLIGINPPNYDPEKYMPRRAWLVPAPVFLQVEQMVIPFQRTLPYKVRPGMRREMQARQLDAVTLLAKYELRWSKATRTPNKRVWAIPDSHEFAQTYILPPEPCNEETHSHERVA